MSDTRAWWSELGRVLGAVLLLAVVAGARETRAQDNLFRDTTDERIIRSQVQLALAPLERGYEQLTVSTSPEQIDVAVQSLKTAYKYLRAAQEGSQRIQTQSKYPDPMLKLRMDRIWAVRQRLLNCIDNQPHLDGSDGGGTRDWCLNGLPEAIRRLRILTVALP